MASEEGAPLTAPGGPKCSVAPTGPQSSGPGPQTQPEKALLPQQRLPQQQRQPQEQRQPHRDGDGEQPQRQQQQQQNQQNPHQPPQEQRQQQHVQSQRHLEEHSTQHQPQQYHQNTDHQQPKQQPVRLERSEHKQPELPSKRPSESQPRADTQAARISSVRFQEVPSDGRFSVQQQRSGGSSRYEATLSEQSLQKNEVLGEWLFEGGLESKVARRLAAKSEVLKALSGLNSERYTKRNQQERWIKTQKADLFFAVVILAYAVLAGIDVEIAVRPIHVSAGIEWTLFVMQVAFMLIFILELVLRVIADGWRFCSPVHNMAGFFDTAIIFLGSAELVVSLVAKDANFMPGFGVMRLFRLLRTFRIVRVLLVRKELKLLFFGMLSSLSAVSWSFVLLSSIMYLGTLICVILLGERENLREFFGSVPMGLFTHFTIVTLEAWPDVADAVIEEDGGIWGVYFMMFICLTSLALMNLVTGVVCDKLMGASADTESADPNKDQVEVFAEETKQIQEKLHQIYRECDWDESFGISAPEFDAMMARADMKKLFETMAISTDLEGTQLFELLDIENKEELSFDEVSAGLLRLRGSRHRLHSMLLQKDLLRGSRRESDRAMQASKRLRKQATSELAAKGALLLKELEEIKSPLDSLAASFPPPPLAAKQAAVAPRATSGEQDHAKQAAVAVGSAVSLATANPACASSSASHVGGPTVSASGAGGSAAPAGVAGVSAASAGGAGVSASLAGGASVCAPSASGAGFLMQSATPESQEAFAASSCSPAHSDRCSKLPRQRPVEGQHEGEGRDTLSAGDAILKLEDLLRDLDGLHGIARELLKPLPESLASNGAGVVDPGDSADARRPAPKDAPKRTEAQVQTDGPWPLQVFKPVDAAAERRQVAAAISL